MNIRIWFRNRNNTIIYKINNMKNYLIKSILLIAVIALFLSESYAIVMWPNIKVKLDSSWDETYSTILEWVSNNDTLLDFEIVWLYTWSSTWSYSLGLPLWFESVSSSIWWTTCNNQSVSNFTNTTFSYDIAPTNQDCVSKIVLTYKVTSSVITWNHKINIIDTISWAEVSNLDISITSLNSLINSETLDQNWNGYIDTYKLVFNTSTLTNFSNTNLTIWTLTPTLSSISWDTVYLSITDSVYKTWEKPNINDSDWAIFDNVWILTEITPTDKAAPILETVNWFDLSSDLSITQDWNLILKFSENLFPTSNNYIFLQKDSINIASTNTFTELDVLEIDPVDTLAVWNYSIISVSWAKDWSSNPNSLIITVNELIVNDSESPVWEAFWISMWISINSWNSTTNNKSVQLSIWATDNVWVMQMKIWNQSDLSDWAWENYSTSKLNHSLIWTVWTNYVYIQFKDNAWNLSSIYSDTIEYEYANDYIMFDNVSLIYTTWSTINVSWLCNFSWSTIPDLVFKNSVISGTWTCNSWYFSNTYTLSEWQNTLEAYFDWTSILWSLDIYKDTTAPNISFSPTATNSYTQYNSFINIRWYLWYLLYDWWYYCKWIEQ